MSTYLKSTCTIVVLFLFCNLFGQSILEKGLNSFIKENNKQYKNGKKLSQVVISELKEMNYPKPNFATAIVFPELMRYSNKMDMAETFVTELSYSVGSNYLTCSIGRFQIKPRFAEQIELQLDTYHDKSLLEKYSSIVFHGKNDDSESRYQRVRRLQKNKYQLLYLCAFIDLITIKYSLSNKNEEYQLKILATAYNWGLEYSINELENLSKINTYPFGKKNNSSRWNYSQLVLDFYFSS